jgi:N-carbamoylputrescine amidase
MLKVAAVQMRMGTRPAENVARAKEFVRQAAAGGARLILLPELFETRYFPQTEDESFFASAHTLADGIGPLKEGPSDSRNEGHLVTEFRRLARELGVVLPLSFFERASNSYYNSLVLIDEQGDVGPVYRKAHIPDGPHYEEKFYFAPGNTPFTAWSTPWAKVGCGICWDQWFPECARSLALQGAEILFYPTAIGSEPPEASSLDTRAMWRAAMVGHAVCNGVPVVAANRVGQEDHMRFYGHSFICDPTGQILAHAGEDDETILHAELDLAHWQRHRAAMGFFRDRRPDLYGDLMTREGVPR